MDSPNCSSTPPPAVAGTPLAQGSDIFERTAGGVGCAFCHGMDATGDETLGAPDIRGASEDRVRAALVGVVMMSEIELTDAEIAAVVAHLQTLDPAR